MDALSPPFSVSSSSLIPLLHFYEKQEKSVNPSISPLLLLLPVSLLIVALMSANTHCESPVGERGEGKKEDRRRRRREEKRDSRGKTVEQKQRTKEERRKDRGRK